MFPVRRILFLLTIGLSLLFIAAPRARAHAIVVRSNPADGTILATAPEQVTIWFDEEILVSFSSAELFDSNSQPVLGVQVQENPGHPDSMIVRLPPLSDGVYSVLWRALSTTDGHYSQGILVFGVGDEADLTAASRTQEESGPEWPEIVLRWLHFALLLTTVGALGVVRVVLPAKADPAGWQGDAVGVWLAMRRRLYTLARRTIGLAAVVGLAMLFWETSTLLFGASLDRLGGALDNLLIRTQWGQSWIAREAAIVGLWFVLGQTRRFKDKENDPLWFWPMTGFLVLAMLLAQAFSSHASGVDIEPLLAVFMDAFHLLAAGLWIGSLLSLALVTWESLRRPAGLGPLARLTWKRFGLLAGVAVGLLLATGLYSTGVEVASIDAFLLTIYGNALLIKLALVAGAGVVGLLNTLLLHPELARLAARLFRRPEGWTPLRRANLFRLIVVECVLGVAVILATAVVTSSAAPRGIEHTIIADEIPSSISKRVDDMVITLRVNPNRPGQNVFTVFAISKIRPAPAEVMRVILRFRYQEEEAGMVQADAAPVEDTTYTLEPLEQGRYLVSGNYLSLAGHWSIDVVVRRRGMEDAVAHMDWVVAPAGSLRPVVISKQPIRPWLTVASALVLMLLPLLILLVSYVRRRLAASPRDVSTSTA